jgi:pimeloyl-ACP methyl ester carboxylesterase
MGAGTMFSAGAFIAPLFEASIPITKPVEHHLYSDPLVMSLGEAITSVEKPILIVYGACEEVVPVSQIRDVCAGIRNEGGIELCVFPEEGHIFKTTLAWQTTQRAIHEFFALHLIHHHLD